MWKTKLHEEVHKANYNCVENQISGGTLISRPILKSLVLCAKVLGKSSSIIMATRNWLKFQKRNPPMDWDAPKSSWKAQCGRLWTSTIQPFICAWMPQQDQPQRCKDGMGPPPRHPEAGTPLGLLCNSAEVSVTWSLDTWRHPKSWWHWWLLNQNQQYYREMSQDIPCCVTVHTTACPHCNHPSCASKTGGLPSLGLLQLGAWCPLADCCKWTRVPYQDVFHRQLMAILCLHLYVSMCRNVRLHTCTCIH